MVISKLLPEQRERIATLRMVRPRMATITVKVQFYHAFKSKLRPAIELGFWTEDSVRVDKQKGGEQHGLLKLYAYLGSI